jgi:serine/threonine-protein kinase HipA
MNRIKHLTVFYHRRKVGTLALYQNRQAAFEYTNEWIANGFSISPLSLPLEKKVFLPNIEPFEGLFGVFSDSLPDGWGRLLVDRLMLKNHMNPHQMGCLDRLAIVGTSGMGALSYEPEFHLNHPEHDLTLDEIAKECHTLLKTEYSENLDTLFALGGSSGGARPKILTSIDNEDWIIKFPSSYDVPSIGKQEYDYALCAKECGISMAEVRLFSSELCPGYFGTKRFDRVQNSSGEERIHMISASALLETSHRIFPPEKCDVFYNITSYFSGYSARISFSPLFSVPDSSGNARNTLFSSAGSSVTVPLCPGFK